VSQLGKVVNLPFLGKVIIQNIQFCRNILTYPKISIGAYVKEQSPPYTPKFKILR